MFLLEFLPTEKSPLIFPNPTNDQLYIESEIPIENVKVYNLFGQLVKEANTTNLVLSNLPSAFYLIKIEYVQNKYYLYKIYKE